MIRYRAYNAEWTDAELMNLCDGRRLKVQMMIGVSQKAQYYVEVVVISYELYDSDIFASVSLQRAVPFQESY